MNDSGIREIVLFQVGEITCGIDIRSVHEIKRAAGITAVYGVAEDITGVLNLRGQIVTVLDMRKRFNFEPRMQSGEERIMIVPNGDEAVGLLVDAVEDVIVLDTQSVLPVPPTLDSSTAHFLKSVYQWEERIVSLVDINALVEISPSTIGL